MGTEHSDMFVPGQEHQVCQESATKSSSRQMSLLNEFLIWGLSQVDIQSARAQDKMAVGQYELARTQQKNYKTEQKTIQTQAYAR